MRDNVRSVIILLLVCTMLSMINIAFAADSMPEGKSLSKEDIPKLFPAYLKPEVLKLFSENRNERIAGIYALGNTGKKASIATPFLVGVLHGSISNPSAEDIEIAKITLDALGKIGDKSAVKMIIFAYKNKNKEIRKASIITLGKIADPATISPLIGALKEGFEVKVTSDAILRFGEHAVAPLLMEIKNNAPTVRVNVISLLAALGDKSAVEPLIRTLEDRDLSVMKASITALGRLRDQRAFDPLLKMFASSKDDISNLIISAFGSIGDKRAYKFIIDRLGDKSKTTRIATIRALGQLGDMRAVEPLIMRLDEKDWNVQRYTMWALKNLTEQNFGKDKAAWQKWYDKNKGK